jgi:hypothetical protein
VLPRKHDLDLATPTLSAADLTGAGRTVADLAVAAGRELAIERLVTHARALGPDPQLSRVSDAELERRFVSHTVALNAATAQWFVLLAEVVVRGVWADQGARTPRSVVVVADRARPVDRP